MVPCPVGFVGIFWGIRTPMQTITLLTDRTALTQAERYGDFLTHPTGHYEFWTHLRRFGAAALVQQGLPPAVLTDEYEEWPRGRVVFDTRRGRFVIYADRKLLGGSAVDRIAAVFVTPPAPYVTASDEHYRSTQSIQVPAGPPTWRIAVPTAGLPKGFHVIAGDTAEAVRTSLRALAENG